MCHRTSASGYANICFSFYGNYNKHISATGFKDDNNCPSCGVENETTEHLNTCPNEDWRDMFDGMVYDLVEWMYDTHTPAPICKAVLDYLLLSRGQRSMRSLLIDYEEFEAYAEDHDNLGWSNFLEGRVSTSLFSLQ